MSVEDDEPFDKSTPRLHLGLGDSELKVRAEALREMHLRAQQWGLARGFEGGGWSLSRTAESVEVTIQFSTSVAEMCTLRSSALQPVELHVEIEPKSWTDWVAARLGTRFETADRTFDEHWHVKTSDASLAKRLLDARVRAALAGHPIWCRAVYSNGHIVLSLDSSEQRLTGAHLLAAIEVATALSRATPQLPTAPYR